VDPWDEIVGHYTSEEKAQENKGETQNESWNQRPER
jgi:hypothetical protein